MGICAPGVAARSTELSLGGGRGAIRRGACAAALDLLVGIVDEGGNESGT
ncbi:hypothetical protein G6027_06585 [Dietzia sp. SLG310A2-38A2]|nr:hypothetical protein [Dietzia sp. SLG310A2-38A2]